MFRGGLARLRGQQLDNRRRPKLAADKRCALDECPLARAEPIEACGEQALDRRGNAAPAVPPGILCAHREQLLDEEWIAVSGRNDVVAFHVAQASVAQAVREQLERVVVGQWCELQDLHPWVFAPVGSWVLDAPVGSGIEQFGP